ncbi:MAG: hypothetical protein U0263_25115 [Polyangiaceae bacterium]
MSGAPSRAPERKGVPRRPMLYVALAIAAAVVGYAGLRWYRFPSDRTPEGAYFRIAKAVNLGRPEDFFAYTETEAQHACYTIRNYKKQARERVLASYPEPERSRLAESYAAEAQAPDGADVFRLHAERRGWVDRLRKDLSGIAKVEIQGERATIETAKGTRYAFRRRENGIWGLTMFTAALSAEAEKAARDAALIEQAAADYDRVRNRETPPR